MVVILWKYLQALWTKVISTCLSIKSKQSTGHDNISNLLIKQLIPILAKPLTHIFNTTFETGIFPNSYKIAKIIPVFKVGDKLNPANYRPISLLTAFSKILEKIIAKRLTNFLFKHKVFFCGQYGFIHGRSTEHAMIEITSRITEAIEIKLLTLGIFLDLSKAFDTLSHEILLRKLSIYGIRGIAHKLFSSYLTNRIQYIDTGTYRSLYFSTNNYRGTSRL